MLCRDKPRQDRADSVGAGVYVKHKFKQATEQIKSDLGQAIGSFRVELRKLTTSATDTLDASARRVRAEIVSADQQAQKARRAEQAQHRSAEAVQNAQQASNDEPDDDFVAGEEDVAWGELSAMWTDVWNWIKDLRDDAVNGETGRKLTELRKLDLRSPTDVIVKLYNYGWFEDRASDLALDMAATYLRHRSRAVPVTRPELREFRKMYEEWNTLPG